ncbi:MAG TPA: DUF2752 domain-containing protein [Chryseosolibacter sp.]
MFKRIPWEGLIWATGLIMLACADTGLQHFTLCPLENAGWNFCPGCGLGGSITLFFHGRLVESFLLHPLGIFAVFTLSFRIIILTKHYFQDYGKSY